MFVFSLLLLFAFYSAADAHKADARVDRLNLTVLLKDFMHLDPTTRYQVAKNAFIRELNEFRVSCFLRIVQLYVLTK